MGRKEIIARARAGKSAENIVQSWGLCKDAIICTRKFHEAPKLRLDERFRYVQSKLRGTFAGNFARKHDRPNLLFIPH